MPRGSGATVSVAASGSYWSVPAAAGRGSPAPRYSVLLRDRDAADDLAVDSDGGDRALVKLAHLVDVRARRTQIASAVHTGCNTARAKASGWAATAHASASSASRRAATRSCSACASSAARSAAAERTRPSRRAAAPWRRRRERISRRRFSTAIAIGGAAGARRPPPPRGPHPRACACREASAAASLQLGGALALEGRRALSAAAARPAWSSTEERHQQVGVHLPSACSTASAAERYGAAASPVGGEDGRGEHEGAPPTPGSSRRTIISPRISPTAARAERDGDGVGVRTARLQRKQPQRHGATQLRVAEPAARDRRVHRREEGAHRCARDAADRRAAEGAVLALRRRRELRRHLRPPGGALHLELAREARAHELEVELALALERRHRADRVEALAEVGGARRCLRESLRKVQRSRGGAATPRPPKIPKPGSRAASFSSAAASLLRPPASSARASAWRPRRSPPPPSPPPPPAARRPQIHTLEQRHANSQRRARRL